MRSLSLSLSRSDSVCLSSAVTGNDTDAAWVAANKDGDGTAQLGMFWRVNGAAIFSKGANMIPMEELEGRMSDEAHRVLVQNAAEGGMNTLRVWGYDVQNLR